MNLIEIIVGRGMKLWVDGKRVKEFSYEETDTGWSFSQGDISSIDMEVPIEDFYSGSSDPEKLTVVHRGETYTLPVRLVLTPGEGESKVNICGEQIVVDESNIMIFAAK